MAQAHEDVAYATYVEKYSSGKSNIEFASKVFIFPVIILVIISNIEFASKVSIFPFRTDLL